MAKRPLLENVFIVSAASMPDLGSRYFGLLDPDTTAANLKNGNSAWNRVSPLLHHRQTYYSIRAFV